MKISNSYQHSLPGEIPVHLDDGEVVVHEDGNAFHSKGSRVVVTIGCCLAMGALLLISGWDSSGNIEQIFGTGLL
jgi:hypothetical protein